MELTIPIETPLVAVVLEDGIGDITVATQSIAQGDLGNRSNLILFGRALYYAMNIYDGEHHYWKINYFVFSPII